MLYSDEVIRRHVVAMTRNPQAIEPRGWVAITLAAAGDPQGVKLLREMYP